MNIDSARALKLEVLSDILERDPNNKGKLAVGIAPGPCEGAYRLAIRVAKHEGTTARVIDEIIKRAAHETDIRPMERTVFRDPGPASPNSGPLKIGTSVSHYRSNAGTLGFFARRLRDGVIGFVSCNHVIALQDEGVEGDEIVSGAEHEHRQVIGYLDGGYPRLRQPTVDVDCAFAELAPGVEYDPRCVGSSQSLESAATTPTRLTAVEKIGRTTGRTSGRITAFDLSGIEMEYWFGIVRLNAQIEIESTNERPFSRAGDSGSLVFTAEQPVGLICAASFWGGAGNTGLTYATPIHSVLSTLDVEMAF